ncbi:MAG: cholinesterase ChoE [Acetobacteraceae bacterium]
MADRIKAAAAIAAVLLSAWAAPGHAGSYSAEYVFGDSLSDNGNLAEVFYQQNLPNPPSYHDSFTNGPVAVQLLASSFGLATNPSLWVTGFQDVHGLFGGAAYVPGTNYAVAAATAALQAVGGPPGINLPQQVGAFSAHVLGSADPNALYVVMIGGNDVRNATKQGTGAQAIAAGVQSELGAVQTLAGEGARKFLVVNVADVGIIPEFAQDSPALAGTATAYSQQYDQLLAAGLSALAVPAGTSVSQFDLYGFNNGLIANAAAYGLTDTTDRCYTATPFSTATSPQCGAGALNIANFVYWDAIHPTATIHALWATGMEAALQVPEPSSRVLLGMGLVGVGLVGLAGVGRRRAEARAG